MPKLLTRHETAELLRLSLATLDHLRHDGLLPYIKIRNTVRFVREDVLEFLARNRIAA